RGIKDAQAHSGRYGGGGTTAGNRQAIVAGRGRVGVANGQGAGVGWGLVVHGEGGGGPGRFAQHIQVYGVAEAGHIQGYMDAVDGIIRGADFQGGRRGFYMEGATTGIELEGRDARAPLRGRIIFAGEPEGTAVFGVHTQGGIVAIAEAAVVTSTVHD